MKRTPPPPTDPPDAPDTADAARPGGKCDKRQAHKRRKRKGRAVLRAELHEHDFCEALIVSGRRTESECLRRAELDAALSEIAAEWIQRWLKK